MYESVYEGSELNPYIILNLILSNLVDFQWQGNILSYSDSFSTEYLRG